MIHVLMVSLDTSLIAQPEGDSAQRHLAYARAAGKLTIIAYTPPGCRVVDLSPELRIIPTNSRHKLLFAFDVLRSAARVTESVDLITTQDPFLTGLVGVWLRWRLRVPLLVQNHSYIFGNQAWIAERPIRNRLLHGIGRFVVKHADMYRTVNRKERENYLASGGSPDRAVVLPLGTVTQSLADPVDETTLATLRARLGLLPQQPVVLWVGYPVGFKRVPLLFEVFREVLTQLPEARLVLIGDPRQSPDDLPALARRIGIADSVVMYGPVRHADLPSYYALGHVYVHTSAYEGMGRVLAEASAAGLPLVGMKVTAVDELIEDGVNGYLIADGDVEAMAERICQLLRDPARARQMGEAARKIAFERYAAADYAQAWVDTWKRTVELGMKSG